MAALMTSGSVFFPMGSVAAPIESQSATIRCRPRPDWIRGARSDALPAVGVFTAVGVLCAVRFTAGDDALVLKGLRHGEVRAADQ